MCLRLPLNSLFVYYYSQLQDTNHDCNQAAFTPPGPGNVAGNTAAVAGPGPADGAGDGENPAVVVGPVPIDGHGAGHGQIPAAAAVVGPGPADGTLNNHFTPVAAAADAVDGANGGNPPMVDGADMAVEVSDVELNLPPGENTVRRLALMNPTLASALVGRVPNMDATIFPLQRLCSNHQLSTSNQVESHSGKCRHQQRGK